MSPARWALAALLLAAGVGLIIIEHSARTIEALVASKLAPLLFANDAIPAVSNGNPAFAIGYGEHWYAFVITAECSIAFYLGAILVVSAAIALLPRIRATRLLTATLIAMVLMTALNQVRFLGLAIIRAELGAEAFNWAHTLGGSILMLFGLGGCLFLFLMYVVRPSRRRKGA